MMTKEQWGFVESELKRPYAHVKFLIDGYEISVVPTSNGKAPPAYHLMVFVDGSFKGEYLKNEEICKRFYFKRRLKKYKPSALKLYKRLMGKKEYERRRKATFDYYVPDWGSFSLMKAHFVKNNESIELITE